MPTVSIENIYAKILWQAPSANGAAITAYRVYLKHQDGVTWSESSNCESNDPLLVQNLYCYVPMDELTDGKFGLAYDELVIARV